MKKLLFILVLCLSGCAARIDIRLVNPEGIAHTIQMETARRTMIAVDGGEITVITGQVAINDETVRALGREVPKIITVAEDL